MKTIVSTTKIGQFEETLGSHSSTNMPRSFKDEGSDRASSEFLIEHDTRPRNAKKRPWGTVQAVIAGVLILVGVMEMIILESILLRFGAKDCPQPLLGELNDLVPTCNVPEERPKKVNFRA